MDIVNRRIDLFILQSFVKASGSTLQSGMSPNRSSNYSQIAVAASGRYFLDSLPFAAYNLNHSGVVSDLYHDREGDR